MLNKQSKEHPNGSQETWRQKKIRTLPSGETQGVVQHSLHAMAQVWRCPSREEVQRTWNAGLRERCRIVPISPLIASLPGRVAQLRGLGNAIVPQVAAEFIAAFMETECLVFERELREVQLSQFELDNE